MTHTPASNDMNQEYLVKGLANICIHTRELEKSLKFYSEFLGFEPYYSYVLKDGNLKGMRLHFLRVGSCIVMLVQPLDLSWVQPLGNTNGDHFALEVQGLDELVEKLRAAGYAFEESQPIGKEDFFPAGRRTIHFHGPSGERIGLVEYGFRKRNAAHQDSKK